jgi:hypothetical protein
MSIYLIDFQRVLNRELPPFFHENFAAAAKAGQLRSRSATWNARSSDWLALSRGSQVVV